MKKILSASVMSAVVLASFGVAGAFTLETIDLNVQVDQTPEAGTTSVVDYDSTTTTNTDNSVNDSNNTTDSSINDNSVADSNNTDDNSDNSTTDNSVNVADSGNTTDNSVSFADSGNTTDSSTTDNSVNDSNNTTDSSTTDNSVTDSNNTTYNYNYDSSVENNYYVDGDYYDGDNNSGSESDEDEDNDDSNYYYYDRPYYYDSYRPAFTARDYDVDYVSGAYYDRYYDNYIYTPVYEEVVVEEVVVNTIADVVDAPVVRTVASTNVPTTTSVSSDTGYLGEYSDINAEAPMIEGPTQYWGFPSIDELYAAGVSDDEVEKEKRVAKFFETYVDDVLEYDEYYLITFKNPFNGKILFTFKFHKL